MTYNRVNNLIGWVVCLIACTVYLLTMEPTTSFWDTGEFISAANKLQIPHPPGAPLFILLGRFFIILFGDHPATAAIAVNTLSAVASGFTILFLFWTITYFARKLVNTNNAKLSASQMVTVMGAGAVGALAYTFSDSFWFSAVEGEVYALSSFFTAIVFWAALKWEKRADEPGADKWLIFIFFLMGLSIGVHLLNLLTIPAIVMIFYFRKFKPTVRGSLVAFITGCVITGLVQIFVIQYSVKGAGAFDKFFTNELGLPFFTGFTVFFVLLAAALVYSIRFAARRKKYYLHLGAWGVSFMLLGYSTYITTMLRSNANPAMDMFNVDSPLSLEGYLGRQQYGDWPIMYGPDFTDRAPVISGKDLYVKGEKEYEASGKIAMQDWGGAPSSHLFPRMWDAGDDRNQAALYRNYSGLGEGETPTMANNLKFFASYQAGWMYMRYFMWNFAGKQNDLQGFGNVRDSNWISGLPFVDNVLYGKQENLPQSVHQDNKAYNRLFMLPLALGIAGMMFQYKRNRKNFFVNGLLFFFTGLAIVVYLNQSGQQPRERDYAFVGSFYAFAVWIGLGAMMVADRLAKMVQPNLAPWLATALCVTVPALMANQEWDDHDRSQKTLARDMAKDYLSSCPPNAILFTFEDNDTYPLWYAQEIEGIRPDVRVIVHTLAGSDWYLDQLRYKINKSDPFDVILTRQQTQGSRREILFHTKLPGFDDNKYYDLYSTLRNVIGSDDPRYTMLAEDGETYNLLPVRKFSVPVDVEAVKRSGLVKKADSVLSEIRIDISAKNHLLRNDLAILAVIASGKWERPVCFTSSAGPENLGISKYLRQEGMIYRLVPLENSEVDNERSYDHMMKFEFGNTGTKDVYLDEDNRRRLNIIKLAHAQVAISLVNAGKIKEAKEILHHFDDNVSSENLPHGMTSGRGNQHNAISSEFLRAAYLAGDKELVTKISMALQRDLKQQLFYYRALGDESFSDGQLAEQAWMYLQNKTNDLNERQASMAGDILSSYQILHQMEQWK